MSVINRMLQELDARGAAQPTRPLVMPQRRASARRTARRSARWQLLPRLLGTRLLGSWLLWAVVAAALLAWAAAQHTRPEALQHGWQKMVRNVQSFWPERAPHVLAQRPAAATPVLAVAAPDQPPASTVVVRGLVMDASLSAVINPPRSTVRPTRASAAQPSAPLIAKAAEDMATDAAVDTHTNAAPSAAVAAAPVQRFTMIDPPAAGAASSTVARAAAAHRHALDLAEEGRETAALDAALDVLRIEPRHMAAHRLAAALAINLNRFEQADALISAGLGMQPGDAELTTLRARLLAASGQGDAALAALQELQRPSADALGLKAGLLARDGHYLQAARAYEQALREQPGNATWWLGLGVALDAQGQTQSARQAFARAHALGTLRPDLQGWIEQKIATQR